LPDGGFVKRLGGWLIVCLLFHGYSVWSADNPEQSVVVIANANIPESVELARHYMQARHIPENNLCTLDLPTGEIMSRKYYDQRLRRPLLEFLRSRDLVIQVPSNDGKDAKNEPKWTTLKSSVRYLVSVYGVPLKIADMPMNYVKRLLGSQESVNTRTDAAVDSELALLLYSEYALEGPYQNPLFNQFSLADLGPSSRFLLLAARLDGPDPETARRLVDDALLGERYGIQGRGYFDGQGLKDSSYYSGESWLREAYERLRREGYECVLDQAEPVWGMAYPVEDAGFYMGWYAADVCGPFVRPDFKFVPGSVAYHLHSGSASTLRSQTKTWVGPLLARGAAASMGAVREPYLSFTPQLDIFTRRLCDGHSFGESAYMSLSVVSWQITIVGDPLYRPFRYSLDEQIKNLEADRRPELDWALVRKVNQLVLEGRFNVALQLCRSLLARRDSLILREKLGDLYARNELYPEAGVQYEKVIQEAKTAETAMRVGARWILILRLTGQKEKAAQLEASLRERWKNSPILPWLETAVP
jgi:uncharacterized protein (TIGR03790 family)